MSKKNDAGTDPQKRKPSKSYTEVFNLMDSKERNKFNEIYAKCLDGEYLLVSMEHKQGLDNGQPYWIVFIHYAEPGDIATASDLEFMQSIGGTILDQELLKAGSVTLKNL